MNNFFSGHNMANEIMQKTSLPMQMDRYVNDHRLGIESRKEFHPERLDPDYETKKPFLASIQPTVTPLPELYPSEPILRCARKPIELINEKPSYIPEPEPVFKPRPNPAMEALLNLYNNPEPICTIKPRYTPEPVLMPEPIFTPKPFTRPVKMPDFQLNIEPTPVFKPKTIDFSYKDPEPISFLPERKKPNLGLNIPDYSTPPYDLGTLASSSSGRSYSSRSSAGSGSRSTSTPVNPLDALANHVQGKIREAEDWGRNAKNTLDTACNNVKNVLDSIGSVVQKLFGG